MEANKLTLNYNKSNFLIIDYKQNSPSLSLNLHSPFGTIKTASKAKYLGVILDEKLNFSEHIISIEKKVSRSVGILGKLKHYLTKQKTLLSLYYFLIQSQFTYGSIAWGNTYLTHLSILGK